MDDPRFEWDWFNLAYHSNLSTDSVATLWWSRHSDAKEAPWIKYAHIGGLTGNPDNPGLTHGKEWWYVRKPKTSKHQQLIDVNKISYYKPTKFRPVYSTTELRKILKELGLKSSGKKEEIIVRLVDDIKLKDPELYAYMNDSGIIRWLDRESRGWETTRFPRY